MQPQIYFIAWVFKSAIISKYYWKFKWTNTDMLTSPRVRELVNAPVIPVY